ncbi:MAG TPA: SDR family oxidoreductase [Candidatus Dormibacteraeota bacterium]
MSGAAGAALVTGGSSGIGLAIGEVLAEEGYALTLCSRREDKLRATADRLRARGHDIQDVAANMASEEDIKHVMAAHRERFGRLDVLVNNAGVGSGAGAGEVATKRVDLQLDVNLRAVILMYREGMELLRAAAAERGSALVVNVASIAGLRGAAWLGVYSATKHGVVGYTRAMNRELGPQGIRSTALCPAFVDTDMTEFIRDRVPRERMIRVEDVAGAVRWLIHTSPYCVVPEIPMTLPGDADE